MLDRCWPEPDIALKPMTAGAEVIQDYNTVGLSLRQHTLSFLRQELDAERIIPCREAMRSKDRRYVQVAGMVLVRQRPGSANGDFHDDRGRERRRQCRRLGEGRPAVQAGALRFHHAAGQRIHPKGRGGGPPHRPQPGRPVFHAGQHQPARRVESPAPAGG